MNNLRVEAQSQQIHGKLMARRDKLPNGNLDVAYGDIAYLEVGLDELYYGIASGESNAYVEASGLDSLDHDNPGI